MSEPAESTEQFSQSLVFPEPVSRLNVPPETVPPKSVALDAAVLEDSQNPFAMPAVPLEQPSSPPLTSYSQYPYPAPQLKEKVYSVPRRFGMAGLLAIMTALACLFGVLRLLDTPPVIYLFLGTEVMVICVAQMLYNAEPRRASMVAGAILMPVFSLGTSPFLNRPDQAEALYWTIPSVLFGAFAGYLVGTCVAGIFLLMDKLEPFLPGGKKEKQ